MIGDRSYTGLILESGHLNRVHYGLAMAAAALAISQPVVLFFTNAALLSLRAPDPEGRPGWATCPLGPDLVAAGVAGDATGWNAGLVTRGRCGQSAGLRHRGQLLLVVRRRGGDELLTHPHPVVGVGGDREAMPLHRLLLGRHAVRHRRREQPLGRRHIDRVPQQRVVVSVASEQRVRRPHLVHRPKVRAVLLPRLAHAV